MDGGKERNRQTATESHYAGSDTVNHVKLKVTTHTVQVQTWSRVETELSESSSCVH